MRSCAIPRLLLGLLLLHGCGGGAEPMPPPFSLDLFINSCVGPNCSGGNSPITTAARGSTIAIGYLVDAVIGAEDTELTTRPGCAVNFEIRRGLALVGTVPAAPTCPDSLERLTLDSLAAIPPGLGYIWTIPASLEPGQYRFESVTFRNPPIGGLITLEIE
jgi:hypothetical protein